MEGCGDKILEIRPFKTHAAREEIDNIYFDDNKAFDSVVNLYSCLKKQSYDYVSLCFYDSKNIQF